MRQTTLKPQIEQEAKQRQLGGLKQFDTVPENYRHGDSRDIIGKIAGVSGKTCPVCGYGNIPGLVICWRCGECLDPHVTALAEAS